MKNLSNERYIVDSSQDEIDTCTMEVKQMPAVVDEDECVGCEVCVDECPNEAISMGGDVAVVDESKCDDCGTCVDSCPTEAISVKE